MTQMRLFGSAALPVDNGRHVEGRDPQGMVIGDGYLGPTDAGLVDVP